MAQKIRIDLSVCVTSGQCYYLFPDLIQAGEGGRPEIIASAVAQSEAARVDELINTCPAMAIELDSGGE